MKLMRSNLMGLLLMAVAMFSVSCDDDIETSSLTLDQTQEATITAYLYAELDKTSQGLELAPNGTKVFVSVNNNEFNDNATGSWIDTVYVQNGKIESVVPVTSDGVTVKITPADFEYDQVQPFGSSNETLKTIFTIAGGKNVANVKPGENSVHEFTYDNEVKKDVDEYVSMRFRIKAITNVEDGIKDVAGTDITFYNGDWSQTVTSDNIGIVAINLPKDAATKAFFNFNKKVSVDSDARETYRYKADVSAFSNNLDGLQTLNFGGGTLYE